MALLPAHLIYSHLLVHWHQKVSLKVKSWEQVPRLVWICTSDMLNFVWLSNLVPHYRQSSKMKKKPFDNIWRILFWTCLIIEVSLWLHTYVETVIWPRFPLNWRWYNGKESFRDIEGVFQDSGHKLINLQEERKVLKEQECFQLEMKQKNSLNEAEVGFSWFRSHATWHENTYHGLVMEVPWKGSQALKVISKSFLFDEGWFW